MTYKRGQNGVIKIFLCKNNNFTGTPICFVCGKFMGRFTHHSLPFFLCFLNHHIHRFEPSVVCGRQWRESVWYPRQVKGWFESPLFARYQCRVALRRETYLARAPWPRLHLPPPAITDLGWRPNSAVI